MKSNKQSAQSRAGARGAERAIKNHKYALELLGGKDINQIVNKQLMVHHGGVTHKVGEPCEVCEEAEREWKIVKDLIDTQVNQAYKRVLGLINKLRLGKKGTLCGGWHDSEEGDVELEMCSECQAIIEYRQKLKAKINKLIK